MGEALFSPEECEGPDLPFLEVGLDLPNVVNTTFLRAGDDEENGYLLFRVAYIEAQLVLTFSHVYQGWMPMLPSTDGAICGRLHLIGDDFICGNAFNVTDSHTMHMEMANGGVKNMAEWWA